MATFPLPLVECLAMNVVPSMTGEKPAIDLRLVVLGLALIVGSGYWQYRRSDKIGKAEADMVRLEQLIKDETAAMHEDTQMLGRVAGDRRQRLEAIVASEKQHIDAWQAEWHNLEVNIRELKAEQRVKGAQP